MNRTAIVTAQQGVSVVVCARKELLGKVVRQVEAAEGMATSIAPGLRKADSGGNLGAFVASLEGRFLKTI